MMAAAIVSPGVRRCLLGIRNGKSLGMIKADLSQFVQERKKDSNRFNLSAPELLQNYTSSESPQVEESLTTEEVKSLLLTLKVRGQDETIVDSYTHFMRRAATVLSLDVSGNIILLKSGQHSLLNTSTTLQKKHLPCELRDHARMLQLKELSSEEADVFLEYIRRNLPTGVSMSVEQTDIAPILEYMRDAGFH